jgi:hypothetical protein
MAWAWQREGESPVARCWINFLGRRSEERIPFDQFDRVSIGRKTRRTNDRSVTVYTVLLSGPLPDLTEYDFRAPPCEVEKVELGFHKRREVAEQHGQELAEALELPLWISPLL